jgi:hypothetical protein
MKTKAMLTNYFKAITNVASQGDAREESFYSCLETLLQQFAASTDRSEVHVIIPPKKTKAGFRESVALKPAEASFRQGWKEALAGETKPMSELWEGIGCMPER